MAGANVTVVQLPTFTGGIAAGDRHIMWDLSASTTYQITSSQLATGVFQETAPYVLVASGGTISSTGNFTIGAGTALATNATVGHVMIPSCAGVPSASVVGATGGNIPMVVDTTNYRLYFLMPSGVWRNTALT